jgi:2-polyprenyl-3-methyl-5-hydroxy-6-metoxy-1,4-benzoquinol methylase
MQNNTSFGKFAEDWDKKIGADGKSLYTIQIALPIMLKMFGSLKGKTVYDIATGNGFLARLLKARGAKKVIASDIAPELIQLAKNKYPSTGIDYQVREATDFTGLPKNSFDLVVINQAIFYIRDLDQLFAGLRKILKPKGQVVFNVFHPLFFTFRHSVQAVMHAGQALDLETEAKKYPRSYTEKFYNSTGKNNQDIKFIQYKRPLSTYVNTAAKYGFYISQLAEPPSASVVKGRLRKSKIPSTFIIKAVKV